LVRVDVLRTSRFTSALSAGRHLYPWLQNLPRWGIKRDHLYSNQHKFSLSFLFDLNRAALLTFCSMNIQPSSSFKQEILGTSYLFELKFVLAQSQYFHTWKKWGNISSIETKFKIGAALKAERSLIFLWSGSPGPRPSHAR